MKRTARPVVLSAPEWRAQTKEGKANALSRFALIQRDAGGVPGDVSFIASTCQPDRYGDTIDQTGWVTDAYEENPVLLWAHSYETPPVGKVGALVKGKDDLRCKGIEWTPDDVHEFGAQVGRMVKAGFLNTVSVGFLPLQWEERRDPETGSFLGYHFRRQELLEVSVVPVPANPGALVQSRAFASTLRSWAERNDQSSVQARQWHAEVETWLKAADDMEQAKQVSQDDESFAEMVALLRSLVESNAQTNAHLAELRRDAYHMRGLLAEGLVAKSAALPQDEKGQALAGAMRTLGLFPPR
jgi:HK97 family phage prohead protease